MGRWEGGGVEGEGREGEGGGCVEGGYEGRVCGEKTGV